MALGYDVTPAALNMKAAQAALAIREAFQKIETLSKWLANHPSVDNGDGTTTDPLVAEFGYTADEAYALRLYVETFQQVSVDKATTFDIGYKMTGLE